MTVFERIKHMLIKEFIQIFRDPRMKGVIFIVPIIQLLLFGYAVTTDVKNVTTALYDLDNSVASRELASRFEKSGYFQVVERVGNDARARELLDRADAQAILRMNKGFGERIAAGKTAELQIIFDGADSNTARIALSYATRIAYQHSQQITMSRAERLQGAAFRPGGFELQSRAWFNDNLESRNFYIPGVIALLVLLITLMLTGMAIVREKEIGTMEQIMVTPIRPFEFILGKTAPFALIGFIDVILITVVGVYWFKAPIRGSIPLLFFATSLFLMTSLGAGLLISTVSRTQQQAMMATFFFFFPAQLLSGFMFPIRNMPLAVQYLTYINPMRYFLVILRGIFLKGVGFDILWPQMAALAVMGVVTLALSMRRFKKTMA